MFNIFNEILRAHVNRKRGTFDTHLKRFKWYRNYTQAFWMLLDVQTPEEFSDGEIATGLRYMRGTKELERMLNDL